MENIQYGLCIADFSGRFQIDHFSTSALRWEEVAKERSLLVEDSQQREILDLEIGPQKVGALVGLGDRAQSTVADDYLWRRDQALEAVKREPNPGTTPRDKKEFLLNRYFEKMSKDICWDYEPKFEHKVYNLRSTRLQGAVLKRYKSSYTVLDRPLPERRPSWDGSEWEELRNTPPENLSDNTTLTAISWYRDLDPPTPPGPFHYERMLILIGEELIIQEALLEIVYITIHSFIRKVKIERRDTYIDVTFAEPGPVELGYVASTGIDRNSNYQGTGPEYQPTDNGYQQKL